MPKLFKLNQEKLFEKIKLKEFRDEKKELRDFFQKNLKKEFFPNLTFLDKEYYIPTAKKITTTARKWGEKKKQFCRYNLLLCQGKDIHFI